MYIQSIEENYFHSDLYSNFQDFIDAVKYICLWCRKSLHQNFLFCKVGNLFCNLSGINVTRLRIAYKAKIS